MNTTSSSTTSAVRDRGDPREVTYCDSTAIRALYTVVDEVGITLIVPERGPIGTLLRITGLDQATTVTTTR